MSASRALQRRIEAAAGAALALVGAYFAIASWRLPVGPDPSAPGPGAAPGALGMILILCGCIVVVRTLLAPIDGAGGDEPEENGDTGKLVIAIGLLFAGALLLEPLGFMLSTFLFLAAGFVWLGGAPWHSAAPAAALMSALLWLFFTKLLGVGLPFGRIVEILFY